VEPELAHPGLDERLRRFLRAEDAGYADELGQEGDRVVEAALDRATGVFGGKRDPQTLET
jgi:hypothetical protein